MDDETTKKVVGAVMVIIPVGAMLLTWDWKTYNVPLWIVGALLFVVGAYLILTAKENPQAATA